MEIGLFWNLIFIASASQGIFLALVLLLQYLRTGYTSQVYLALLIFFFTAKLTSNLVYWNQLFGQFPEFLFSLVGARFLYGPLFILYCLTFLNKRTSKWHLIHFLPFLFLFMIYLPQFMLSGAEKIELTRNGNFYRQLPLWRKYIVRNTNWALCIQLIGYAIVIFYLLRSYTNRHQTDASAEKTNQLNWLLIFNTLFLTYGLITLTYWILVQFNIGGVSKDYPISLIMCIMIYGISYLSILNPDLLKGEAYLHKMGFKYHKTPLSSEYMQHAVIAFENLIKKQELFLNPNLKLDDVATSLHIKKHHISQALSLVLGKTFNEYINELRIIKAQKLLDKLSDDDNIKTVMFSCGFNNRASFNNNFKKKLGMTASEYLKSR